MEQGILNSVKKMVGLEASYTAFDLDIILFTNSAFSTLTELGVGPAEGFMIEDDGAEWGDFVEDIALQSSVKTYVYLRVRFLFDPPTTSFFLTAMENQIKEHEWRLNTQREGTAWVDPNLPVP